MKDYYSILGVPREAEVDLIKATYLALSKIYHPDVYMGDKNFAKEKTQEINEAYAVLSSPAKRKKFGKIITLSGHKKNNTLKKQGDINLWLESKAYNQVESIHQIWLLSIIDLMIGKSEYPPN